MRRTSYTVGGGSTTPRAIHIQQPPGAFPGIFMRALVTRVWLIVAVAAITGATVRGELNAAASSSGPTASSSDAAAPRSAATKAVRSSSGRNAAAIGRAWPQAIVEDLDVRVLGLAVGAASCAVRLGAASNPRTLTIIDYSMPSTAKRLWVLDLASHAVLYHELVAHGEGSGDNTATLFSNDADSHRSSLGLFVAEETYIGKNGYSLRLEGLDAGFNDRAQERAIVMHGAPYVSAAFARTHGRLGRSWGCPALPEDVARAVIDHVKGGNLVFSYYPDPRWLSSSQYLAGCAAAS
jgi:hypothetical protein